MAYTKRDLRAADILSMVLIGAGVLLLIIGLLLIVETEDGGVAKGTKGFGGLIGAVVFLALGTALQLKIRQLVRRGGREPEEYDNAQE